MFKQEHLFLLDVALGNILMMANLRKHCVIFRIHWLMPR